MSRILVGPATIEKPPTATPPISDGVLQAFRLPDDDQIPDDHESFDTLMAAVERAPGLPWESLSVFSGEDENGLALT